MKRAVAIFTAALSVAILGRAEMPPIKPAPRRPPSGPSVVVEEFEVLPDCASDQVCAEGLIRNIGSQVAHDVRLRIDIGGTRYGKPRTSLYRDVDKTDLDPTEAQSVSFTVDRKLPYRNERGEERILEVGRYNVKLVPVWRESARPIPKKIAPRPAPKKG